MRAQGPCGYTDRMPPLDQPLGPADFSQALARGDVNIALQPLVNLRSGRVVRFEALARWEDSVRGQIAPATFVPLAEECGEATALAFQVLRRSAADLPAWRTRLPELRIAVNISIETFQDPQFSERLAAFLEANGAAGQWFELEITESTFMREPDRILQAVEDVRR